MWSRVRWPSPNTVAFAASRRSPSREAYRYLLPQFDKTPDPDQDAIEFAKMWLGKESLTKRLLEKAKAAIQSWTTESWDKERLKDGGIKREQ
jgi:hypothetical protein